MRKLIYADDLCHEISQYNYYITYRDVLEEINSAPAVPAIPIEWLEKLIISLKHSIREDKCHGYGALIKKVEAQIEGYEELIAMYKEAKK